MKHRLAQATLVVALFAGLWWNQDRGLKAVAEETHSSLCALKSDIERRYIAGKKFLKQNPQGIPGISADVIRTSISGQESTLYALRDLNC